MSTTHDGCDRSTVTANPGSADRVLEDPNRVADCSFILRSSGFTSSLSVRRRTVETEEGVLVWDEFKADRLKLLRRDAFLFLQGVGLQTWLDTIQELVVSGAVVSPPFKGLALKRLNTDGCLEGLVFAKVLSAPTAATEQVLLGTMLKALAGS
jgi:hypothetical protein